MCVLPWPSSSLLTPRLASLYVILPHLPPPGIAMRAGGGGGGSFRGKRESGKENPYSCTVLGGERERLGVRASCGC